MCPTNNAEQMNARSNDRLLERGDFAPPLRPRWDTLKTALTMLNDRKSDGDSPETSLGSPGAFRDTLVTANGSSTPPETHADDTMVRFRQMVGRHVRSNARERQPALSSPVQHDLPAHHDGTSESSSTKHCASKRRKTPSNALACQWPVDLVALLLSCPLCATTWTARKTAPVKAVHITRCAKSRHHDRASVLRLIQQAAATLGVDPFASNTQSCAIATSFLQLVPRSRATLQVVGVKGMETTVAEMQKEINRQAKSIRQDYLGFNRHSGKHARAAHALDSNTRVVNSHDRSTQPCKFLERESSLAPNTPQDEPRPTQMPMTPSFAPSRLLSRPIGPLKGAREQFLWEVARNGTISQPHCSDSLNDSCSTFGGRVSLWSRILRYEPVTLAALQPARNPAMTHVEINKFGLQDQGITFYAEQTRQRGRKNH